MAHDEELDSHFLGLKLNEGTFLSRFFHPCCHPFSLFLLDSFTFVPFPSFCSFFLSLSLSSCLCLSPPSTPSLFYLFSHLPLFTPTPLPSLSLSLSPPLSLAHTPQPPTLTELYSYSSPILSPEHHTGLGIVQCITCACHPIAQLRHKHPPVH